MSGNKARNGKRNGALHTEIREGESMSIITHTSIKSPMRIVIMRQNFFNEVNDDFTDNLYFTDNA